MSKELFGVVEVQEDLVQVTMMSEVLVMKAEGGKRGSSPVDSGCLWLWRNKISHLLSVMWICRRFHVSHPVVCSQQ